MKFNVTNVIAETVTKSCIILLSRSFDSDKWSIPQAKPIWNVKLWTNIQNGAKVTFKKRTDNFNICR